jgi:hypothetical protein
MWIVETGRLATTECSGYTESGLVLRSLRKTVEPEATAAERSRSTWCGMGCPPSGFVLSEIFSSLIDFLAQTNDAYGNADPDILLLTHGSSLPVALKL